MQANFQINADELGLPLIEKIKAMFAHRSIRISVVASEEPIDSSAPKLKDLKHILEALPRLSKAEAESFANDIEESRRMLNAQPMHDPWQS